MTRTLLEVAGGRVSLPTRTLCDRTDGGHLVVHPPRPVWDRCALDAHEITAWSLLVAATVFAAPLLHGVMEQAVRLLP